MDNYEIVKKLIGPIEPVGSEHIDCDRFDNLQETINLVNKLLTEIVNVSDNVLRAEHSMKKSGITAFKFSKNLNEYLTETLGDLEERILLK